MKSIKEKANEYEDEQSLRIAYNGSCDNCWQGFEVGANYVISCIEKEMLSCKAFSQSQLRLIMNFCEQLEATNK